MNAIEKLLVPANTVLCRNILVDTHTHTLRDDVYDGYLAGFGPAVITSGLIQTLATYAADDKRKKVLDAIAEVAAISSTTTADKLLAVCLDSHSNKPQLNIWRNKIIDASIALKMMIRTYKKPKK